MTQYEFLKIERHGPVWWLFNNRPEQLNATNDPLHRQVSNWLYGYVTGLAAGLRAAQDSAAPNLTNDQLLRSATDYCQANPGATIANAASAWVPQPAPKAEAPAASGRGFFLDLSKPATQPGGRR